MNKRRSQLEGYTFSEQNSECGCFNGRTEVKDAGDSPELLASGGKCQESCHLFTHQFSKDVHMKSIIKY